jgi:tRNA A37 threonylcarbamoyladenosine dehydratase
VGGLIAESLVRTGFEDISLIDFDIIKRHNLDRLNYATHRDVGRPKVDVLSDYLRDRATAANFRVHPWRLLYMRRKATGRRSIVTSFSHVWIGRGTASH